MRKMIQQLLYKQTIQATYFEIALFFSCCAVDASFSTAGVAGDAHRAASDTGKKRAFFKPEAVTPSASLIVTRPVDEMLFSDTLTKLLTMAPSAVRCGRMMLVPVCWPLKFIVIDCAFASDAAAMLLLVTFVACWLLVLTALARTVFLLLLLTPLMDTNAGWCVWLLFEACALSLLTSWAVLVLLCWLLKLPLIG